MSIHAIRIFEMHLIRWLDLAVLAVALPVFLALGLPLLGWGGVAAAWLVQRAVQQIFERRARASGDPKRASAVLGLGMFARVWILALTIFALGEADRHAGIAGALLAVLLVTVHLTAMMTSGPLAPGSRR